MSESGSLPVATAYDERGIALAASTAAPVAAPVAAEASPPPPPPPRMKSICGLAGARVAVCTASISP
jgi:hypothetical protein